MYWLLIFLYIILFIIILRIQCLFLNVYCTKVYLFFFIFVLRIIRKIISVNLIFYLYIFIFHKKLFFHWTILHINLIYLFFFQFLFIKVSYQTYMPSSRFIAFFFNLILLCWINFIGIIHIHFNWKRLFVLCRSFACIVIRVKFIYISLWLLIMKIELSFYIHLIVFIIQ
jgi:hypothetical protein